MYFKMSNNMSSNMTTIIGVSIAGYREIHMPGNCYAHLYQVDLSPTNQHAFLY
jgi:hypothetical protein